MSSAPGASFSVVARHEAGSLVVSPAGELDLSTVDEVRSVMRGRAKDEDLVLDLSGLTFLDTSGLQLVIEAQRASRADGFEFSLRRGPRTVQRVFEIAGLAKLLPFEADA